MVKSKSSTTFTFDEEVGSSDVSNSQKSVSRNDDVGCIFVLLLLIVAGFAITNSLFGNLIFMRGFKSLLSEHLTKNFPELDTKKRDFYLDELTDLFIYNLISKDPKLELEVYMEFESFNTKYRRVYKSDKDRHHRFVNFRESYLEVKEHKANQLYTKGINRFSDMSEKEFYKMFKPIITPIFEKPPPNNFFLKLMSNTTYIKNLKLAKGCTEDIDVANITAENLDWRRTNCLKRVRDQGPCNSAWALATVDSIESFSMLHYDRKYNLSSQQLLDCDNSSFGCKGGCPKSAFSYIRSNGLVFEEDFPYTGTHGPCYIPKTNYDRIDSAFFVFKGKDILTKSLVVSPTVVLLGITPEFTSYKSGIYTGSCADVSNVPVLLVGEGYDVNLKERYWIIKTTWGVDWGEEGYIRLQRTGVGSDKCGVLSVGLHPYVR